MQRALPPFLLDLRTGDRTPLAENLAGGADYSVSPDGGSVFFHLPRDWSPADEWDVWSVPVTGGEPTLVLQEAAFPLPFPDGARRSRSSRR